MPRGSLRHAVLLQLALCVLLSHAAPAANAPAKEDKKNAPVKEEKKDTPAKEEKKEVPAAGDEMAPIDIKLPPPFFGGTEIAYTSVQFEERNFRPRDPFPAPKGATVISKGKTVTSSDPTPAFGKLSMITDGEKGYQQSYVTELSAGKQWIQIDLDQESEIYAILVWHFYSAERVYFDCIVQTADDPEFTKNVQTLYNNDYDNTSGLGFGKDKEYIDDNRGRLVSAFKDGKGTMGRYVRLYSNGNTTDDMNNYIEVEVWGKPLTK